MTSEWKITRKTWRPAMIAGVLVMMQGCAQAVQPGPPPHPPKLADVPPEAQELREQMSTLRQAIVREVGVPSADDVSQCGVVPFGAKACGGPQSYIVYSRKVTNEERLKSLTAQYAQLEQEWNHRNKVISTCSMALPPVPVIVDGQCQAGGNTSGGGAQPQ